MGAYTPVPGNNRLIGLTPANTSEATMFTAAAERPVVVGLIIANAHSSAVAATMKWTDGSTDYPILSAKSIAANDSFFQDVFLPLFDGYEVKVTSGSANMLTFTLVVVERVGSLQGQGNIR